MFARLRSRFLLIGLVSTVALVFSIGAAGAQAPAAASPEADRSAGRGHHPPQVTVVDLEFLGLVTFDTGFIFSGTEVGGLSGITYDARRGVYYSLSDDRSDIDPARYYTLSIDLVDGQLDPGDVHFLGVTTLLDESGAPFGPGALDPEGIVLARPGFLFISSEGDASASPPIDPFVHRYNRNGHPTGALPVPEKFLPDAAGTQGVRNNLAFESLTVSPDVRWLFTGTEGALVQDGPAADVSQESLARLIQYDLRRRRVAQELVYVVDPVAEPPDPPGAFRVNGLVELLALDPAGTLLAMERSFSVGRGNTVLLYEALTQSASDVSGIFDLYDENTGTPVDFEAVDKRLLLDFADLGLVPDNLEGMTFGPQMPDGRYPLIVVSDNNFNPTQVTQFIALAVELAPVP